MIRQGNNTPVRAIRRPASRSLTGRLVRPVLIALLLIGILLLGIDRLIALSAGDAIVRDAEQAQPAEVALLLGTSWRHRGGDNQYYRARIEAAAELFHQSRVRGILVSGDNATRHYNEPITMQRDLMALGVPGELITLDYAGFRTLDSVIRAKEVFDAQSAIIVSQDFHVARALFLARHAGLDATGLAAPSPGNGTLGAARLREVLARVVAVWDVLTGREPRFLGPRETLRLIPEQTGMHQDQR